MQRRAVLLDAATVGIGGATGAILRAGAKRRYGGIWSTAGVNIIGSFALGAIVAATPLTPRVKLGLGAGLCGGFTTFSTFAVELSALIEAGELSIAAGYFVANNVGCTASAFFGAGLTRFMTRGRG